VAGLDPQYQSNFAENFAEKAIASSNYSSKLRRGKQCGQSWEGMNERSTLSSCFQAMAVSKNRHGKRFC
jgi:hypothetical protein